MLKTNQSNNKQGFYWLLFLALLLSVFAKPSLAQNNFVDASLSPKTVTVHGNAFVNYNADSPNTISGVFDGDGDYLSISPNPLPGITSALTIESWIYINSVPEYGWPIISQSKNQGQGEQEFYISGSSSGNPGKLRFLRFGAFALPFDLFGSTTIPLNKWVHVAVTFDGVTARLFVNGYLDASASTSKAWEQTDQPFYVGRTHVPNFPEYEIQANGKISELRITKGYARYKNHFVPMPVRAIEKPITVDPSFSTVSLLLNADGTDGSTQTSDISSNPKVVTFNGNAKISTEKSVFGAGSFKFDSSGDYITVPESQDFQLTGNFTLESWIFLNSTTGIQCVISTRRNNNIQHTPVGLFIEDGKLRLVSSNSTNTAYTVNLYSTSTLTSGVWYHIAGTRSGNTWKIFINGVEEGTMISSHTPYVGTGTTNVGGDSNTNYLNGYLDDVRITKGLARYTSNFSLPQKTHVIGSTKSDEYYEDVSLLLNGNGESGSNITDISVLPKPITVVGSTQVSNSQSKFGGTSLAFNGTNDYLQLPSNSDFDLNDRYTIEMWVKPNSLGNNFGLITRGFYTTSNQTWSGFNFALRWLTPFGAENTYRLRAYFYATQQSNEQYIDIPNALAIDQWTHIAVVRNGKIGEVYINGIKSGSRSDLNTNTNSNQNLKIGNFNFNAVNEYFSGYIDDLRITKGIARYTENFIPPQSELKSEILTNDPFLKDVVLQLDGEGKDNSQFISDTSVFLKNVSALGDTKISTSEFKTNHASLFFDGDGDYLSIPATSDFYLSNNDFTIETWINLKGDSTLAPDNTRHAAIVSQGNGTNLNWTFGVGGSSNGTGTSLVLASSSVNNGIAWQADVTILKNTWYHVALVRASGVTTAYLNGEKVGATNLFSLPLGSDSLNLLVGRQNINSYPRDFNGYIDDLRITKGVARYQSNFMPSTLPVPIKIGDTHSRNTAVLLNGNGDEGSTKIIDASATPKTVTAVGNAKITKAISKFGGASMIFDGQGDYLSSSLPAPGQSDFTIEGWFKPVIGGVGGLAGFSDLGNFNQRCIAQLISVTANSIQLRLTTQSGTGTGKFITGTAPWDGNSWIHFAVQRSLGVGSVYVNGQLVGSGDAINNITGTAFKIGHIYTLSVDTFYSGGIDDVRYTNGIARYTENFTPPQQELQPAQYLYDPYGKSVELSLMTDSDSVSSSAPFVVQTSLPNLSGSVINQIDVNFSNAMDGSTFAASDVEISDQNGSVYAVNQIQLVSSKQFRLSLQSPLSDGQYTLKIGPDIKAQNGLLLDQNNNHIPGEAQDVYVKTFKVDTTPPTPTALNNYPTSINANSYTFSGTKEAGSQVLVNGVVVVDANNSTSWTFTTSLASGQNQFTIVIQDTAGNQSTAVQANISYENTTPSAVNFTISPQGNGQELTLLWPAYDEAANGNDIKHYRIYSSLTNFTDTSALTPVQTVLKGIKTVKLSNLQRNQTYYLAVVAEDNASQYLTNVTAVSAVPIDTKAPSAIGNLLVDSGLNHLLLSWPAHANSENDLAGYRIEYTDQSQNKIINLVLADIGSANPIQYTINELQTASAHNIKVSAYDASGNLSTAVTNAGITLLNNPVAVQVEELDSALGVQWAATNSYSLLKHYAVYIQNAPFTSVIGLTPAKIVAKGTSAQTTISTTLSGLTNGQTVYVAVTAVNNSNAEFKDVAAVSGTPAADQEDPVISQINYVVGNNIQDLRSASTLVQSGKLQIKVADESPISRVVVELDNQPLANLAVPTAQGFYETSLNLEALVDGAHSVNITVFDEHENSTSELVNLNVDLNAPAVPTFSLPAANTTTNQVLTTITGKSAANTIVVLSRSGNLVKDDITVDASGNFSAAIELIEGDNLFSVKARYNNRAKYSADSAARKITLNTQIPDAPTGLVANAIPQGQVALSWNTVSSNNPANQVNGYNLYRSRTTFSKITDAGVVKVNSNLIKSTGYTDLLVQDGNYYFAVSAVNIANNEGNISAVVNVTSDKTAPAITEITYTAQGQFDSANQRFGKGSVAIKATFSEALRNQPYFAIVPQNGLPVSVTLNKDFNDDKIYTGQFTIDASTGSGEAYAVMSAHDKLGNRGTEIEQGDSLLIDTQGPDITQLVLNPQEPLKVDAVSGLDINLEITLNDQPVNLSVIQLIPLLDGTPIAGYENGIVLNPAEGNRYAGVLHLPTTAGQSAIANLSFTYSAQDDLNNISQKILDKNQFQVYQGELPPLDIPQQLTAIALPKGKIKISWQAVDKATAYVIYRQGPNDSSMQALPRLTATEYEDQTNADGTWLYAIASIRNENNQESESAKSNSVSVVADSIAPAAPTNLSLELNGAGIVSHWQAVTQDANGNSQTLQGLTYRLYRLNLSPGQQVIDTTGLTAIQTKIPALIAVDTKPNVNEHSYFVTAVDAAGNESVPGNTAYLNFGLLPVTPLSISLSENGFPQLTWQHKGTAIKEYRVYRKTGSNPASLLTPVAIPHAATTTQYLDPSYNGSLPSNGAQQEVIYSVVAVDQNNVESIAHELLLPALTARLDTSTIKLDRGVFNQLVFMVDNKGTSNATSVRLMVTLMENGVQRTHQSNYFSIAGGASLAVPVVIGGYEKLDAITQLNVKLEQKPQDNQQITISQSYQVQTGQSSLTANLITQDFTRGGTGKVSFSITNTSQVDTEVVTATNNNKSDSNEVRLILEDEQGNLLAKKSVRQTVNGVINVASGQTVARIAPGETFTSQEVTLNIPAAAPDNIRLRLEIDKFHYQLGQATHVAINGTEASQSIALVDTAYKVEITEIQPAVVNARDGEVQIRGKAIDRTSLQAIANVPVSVVLTLRGFERKFTVYTDATGNFVYPFKTENVAGLYTVAALHPSVTDRPNMGSFIAEGGSATPSDVELTIPRNYTQTIPVRVNAGHNTELKNVRLVLLATGADETAQLPTGITASSTTLGNIAPATTSTINLKFSGDNYAADSGLISYRVEADNHTGNYALGTVNIRYKLSAAAPAIATSPTFIDTGVGLGQEVIENISVSNKGLEVLLNAKAELQTKNASAVPAWISLATTELGDLPVGESRSLQLIAAPDASIGEGIYEFVLQLKGDNSSAYKVPVFVKITQSGKGNSFFKISDIYTSTLDSNHQLIEGVQNAKIQLQNENVLSEVFTKNSDSKGEVIFNDIPAGRYTYRISAYDHSTVSGRIWIKPGVTASENIFLMNELVKVEWSVKEITIEDRYEIKLEATFKTNVPAPVVMLQPLHVQLPVMKKGEVFQGEFTLTNHGLIRAYDVAQTLPQSNDLVKFEFLKDIPTALEANEVFVLPYRIQALKDFNPVSDGNASGGGCGSYNASYRVDYKGKCANNTIVNGNAQSSFNANWGSCVSSGGTPRTPVTTISVGSTGGSGGYSGVSYGYGGAALGGEDNSCMMPVECDACDPNNASAE